MNEVTVAPTTAAVDVASRGQLRDEFADLRRHDSAVSLPTFTVISSISTEPASFGWGDAAVGGGEHFGGPAPGPLNSATRCFAAGLVTQTIIAFAYHA